MEGDPGREGRADGSRYDGGSHASLQIHLQSLWKLIAALSPESDLVGVG